MSGAPGLKQVYWVIYYMVQKVTNVLYSPQKGQALESLGSTMFSSPSWWKSACVINVFRTPGEFDDTVLTEFQVGQRSGSMSPGIFPVEVIVSTHLGRMCGVQPQNKVADD